MQAAGATVVPTLQWAERASFDYCFDGLPVGSVVSISTVGVMRNRLSRKAFFDGFDAAMERLAPSTVLLYGSRPKECDFGSARVAQYANTHYRWADERRKAKKGKKGGRNGGSRGAFLSQGGFSEPLKYQEIGNIEGVKVLRDPTKIQQNLPERANASNAYVGVDSRGNVKQLRVFEKRLPSIDIDFGHSHHHGLAKDDFHVHEYPNGERSAVSRTLTSAEWSRWRSVIEEILTRRK